MSATKAWRKVGRRIHGQGVEVRCLTSNDAALGAGILNALEERVLAAEARNPLLGAGYLYSAVGITQGDGEGTDEIYQSDVDREHIAKLTAQLSASESARQAAEQRVKELESMAPYFEASGHYCDGMTAAWSDAQAAEGRAALAWEALRKINQIRNRIVGSQGSDWSRDFYPLVAALEGAGIEGMEFAAARAQHEREVEEGKARGVMRYTDWPESDAALSSPVPAARDNAAHSGS